MHQLLGKDCGKMVTSLFKCSADLQILMGRVAVKGQKKVGAHPCNDF